VDSNSSRPLLVNGIFAVGWPPILQPSMIRLSVWHGGFGCLAQSGTSQRCFRATKQLPNAPRLMAKVSKSALSVDMFNYGITAAIVRRVFPVGLSEG